LSVCPLCGAATDSRILAKATELRPPIVRLIRRLRPGWQPHQGLCPVCAQEYARRFAAQRRAASLHTTTEPNTTFPYYHPDEETVLAQPERLPDHPGFCGRGVTIAFLDSGYYPHPDLLASPHWTNAPQWHRLDSRQLQAALSQRALRIVQYADLSEDGEQVGLAMPSLWDGSGDSWHGQMTSALAVGNGLLSDGRFRGYAPNAQALTIKIGRGDGRIPEADILTGLEWLLGDDNWQRYGVRVLNISVGGDHDGCWRENPVCLAVEELARRGVFVAAAAGNSARERLRAPAQSPSLLTVGGIDDHNRRWRPDASAAVAGLSLYPHNWGVVEDDAGPIRKPELLAPARWLPAPVLPVSPIFQEMHALAALRSTLSGAHGGHLQELVEHWGRMLHSEPLDDLDQLDGDDPEGWLQEIWQALRKRMNAHKWVHPYYQHVDGSSVAAAQVSAVAAQMLEANPNLSPAQIKAVLAETALPLPHLPMERTGAGLLQPSQAVAAALRRFGGPLAGFWRSAVRLSPGEMAGELRNLLIQGKVQPSATEEVAVYLGCHAPSAVAVSVVGPFNAWAPDLWPLQPARNGWWHGVVVLPPGVYGYRFWVASPQQPTGDWLPDPENAVRSESGYLTDHTELVLD
jgi:serine protease AprX